MVLFKISYFNSKYNQNKFLKVQPKNGKKKNKQNGIYIQFHILNDIIKISYFILKSFNELKQ
jgi:hypothetical protein